MSTILDALRKAKAIEEAGKQTPGPTAPEQLPPEIASASAEADPPSYLPGEEGSGGRRQLLIRAVAVAVVGVLLGMLVADRFVPEPEMDASDDLVSEAALKPADPPAQTASPGGDAVPKPVRSDKARRAAPGAKPAPVPAGAAQEGESPAEPTAPPPSQEESIPGSAPPLASAAQVAPAPEAPAAATPPAPATASVLPPPPDDAPQVSLLFIQWSPDPNKRVASLRQQGGTLSIVREGDVLQGMRIAVIRPSAVEVQWRGQSFLMPASRN